MKKQEPKDLEQFRSVVCLVTSAIRLRRALGRRTISFAELDEGLSAQAKRLGVDSLAAGAG